MATDNIFQEFKLYIEGVQVPFISISINQGFGTLPSAAISIPPQSGLMDIARYYGVKVHIFFTERPRSGKEAFPIDKVLFTGIVTKANYSKSKQNNGSAGIAFEVIHRYSLISDCLIDYSGPVRGDGEIHGTDGVLIPTSFNSPSAIQEALAGWNDETTGEPAINVGAEYDYPSRASSTILPHSVNFLPSKLKDFASRLTGIPGILINFWNQLCRAGSDPKLIKQQGVFTQLYWPLLEDGLGFFKRLSGHYFIESLINSSKGESCVGKLNKNILIPPSMQVFFQGVIQGNMSINTLHSFLSNSNDTANMYSIFQTYLQTVDYDWLTLSCPAEVLKDFNDPNKGTYAVDTIVKPGMPFYFSPSCNVIYPSMYTNINVTYDESSLPTRMDVLNKEEQLDHIPHRHFRAPASVRLGIALTQSTGPVNLRNTESTSWGAIGQYEMGRGVKLQYSSMPAWLGQITSIQSVKAPGNSTSTDTRSIEALNILKEAWSTRYRGNIDNPYVLNQPDSMNPYHPDASIEANERILYTTADYTFTKAFASLKSGNVSGPFNPYIIPGYPMDILDNNPTLPSFHAMCLSVTHNITSDSLSTSISFGAAMTYTEMANYYIPFINPYLQYSFGLSKNPNLVGNAEDTSSDAYQAAKKFYASIGATPVFPETVFNFKTNCPRPTFRDAEDNIIPLEGASFKDQSFEDTLMNLCWRPIESKKDFASRFHLNYIDSVPQNYEGAGIIYEDPTTSAGNVSDKFEIGQSQFLTYNTNDYLGIIHNEQVGPPPDSKAFI